MRLFAKAEGGKKKIANTGISWGSLIPAKGMHVQIVLILDVPILKPCTDLGFFHFLETSAINGQKVIRWRCPMPENEQSFLPPLIRFCRGTS